MSAARAAVRRLPLHTRRRYLPHPRHVGHHWTPTAFAISRNDWTRSPAPRIMGRGHPAGRHRVRRAILSLTWDGCWPAPSSGAARRSRWRGWPGTTARAATWLDSTKPQAFYGTPSFALHLAEVAHVEGYDPRNFGLKVMFFSGEPGASVPGVRDRIAEAYNARVIDCGSMAEMTPFMHVSGTADPAHVVCATHRSCCRKTFRVLYGQRGTPVYTHLERTSQPMIRLCRRSSRFGRPGACGRTILDFQGIFGRIDDMLTIRGVIERSGRGDESTRRLRWRASDRLFAKRQDER